MTNLNFTLTSLEVAEMMNRPHSDLLKTIRKHLEYMNEGEISFVENFVETTYFDSKGQERPMYVLSKKACEFLANKSTGKEGTLFTAAYIDKFHNMENTIKLGYYERTTEEMFLEAERTLAIVNQFGDLLDESFKTQMIRKAQQLMLGKNNLREFVEECFDKSNTSTLMITRKENGIMTIKEV